MSAPSLVHQVVGTPLGEMLLAASPAGLALSEFLDGRDVGRLVGAIPSGPPGLARPREPGPGSAAHLDLAAGQLSAYFAGRLTAFSVPLDLRGGVFELSVWQAVARIPFGRTSTYGAIAAGLGRPGAARAVGLANGRNRLAVVVPCHRVLGARGGLVGYGGGLSRKRALLEHEGALLRFSRVSDPARTEETP